jgi:hypothetical protein
MNNGKPFNNRPEELLLWWWQLLVEDTKEVQVSLSPKCWQKHMKHKAQNIAMPGFASHLVSCRCPWCLVDCPRSSIKWSSFGGGMQDAKPMVELLLQDLLPCFLLEGEWIPKKLHTITQLPWDMKVETPCNCEYAEWQFSFFPTFNLQ